MIRALVILLLASGTAFADPASEPMPPEQAPAKAVTAPAPSAGQTTTKPSATQAPSADQTTTKPTAKPHHKKATKKPKKARKQHKKARHHKAAKTDAKPAPKTDAKASQAM